MKRLAALLLLASASLAQGQGQGQSEHVPPDPPQSHVDHDMSYREMTEMMGMDDRRRFGKVMFNRLERHDGDDGSQYAWDAHAWYGGDYHKAWLEAEGERVEDSTHESRIEGGWERIISPWWNVRAGLRHDAGMGPARDWLGAGFTGLAPGFAGLYQINVVVPPGLTAGNQNVQITINGFLSNVATVAVQP